MKSVGPYIVLREMSNMQPRTSVSEQLVQPERLAATMWATDRLTGMPVLLHPVRSANYLPELPKHPSLVHFSDILEVDGQSYLVTQMDLHAMPATDSILAARGALTALTVLHEVGLVHGRLDPSELWRIDDQVVLAGAGLVSAEHYSAAEDLRTLADVLEDLEKLPSVLRILRTAPKKLMARDALGMLEGTLPNLANSASSNTKSALFDFHVPAAEDWDTVKEEESKSADWPSSGIRSINTHLDAPVDSTPQETTHSRLLIDGLPTQPIFVQQVVLADERRGASSISGDTESADWRRGHPLAFATVVLPAFTQLVSTTQQQANTALSVSVSEGVGPLEYLLVDSLAIDLTFSQPHIRANEMALYHQSTTSTDVPPTTSTGKNGFGPSLEQSSSLELLTSSNRISHQIEQHFEQSPQPIKDPEIISERSAVPDLSFDFEEARQAKTSDLNINLTSMVQPAVETEAETDASQKIDIALPEADHLVDPVLDESSELLESKPVESIEKTQEKSDEKPAQTFLDESTKQEAIAQLSEEDEQQNIESVQDLEEQKLEPQSEPIEQLANEAESIESVESEQAESIIVPSGTESKPVDLSKKEQPAPSTVQTEAVESKQEVSPIESEHQGELVTNQTEQPESEEALAEDVAEENRLAVALLSLEKKPNETPQQRRRRENLVLAEHERQEGEVRRAALKEKKAAQSDEKKSRNDQPSKQYKARELKPIRMGFASDGQWKVLRNEPFKSVPLSGDYSPSWFSRAWPVLGVLMLLGLAGGYYLSQELGVWPATLMASKEQVRPKLSVAPKLPCCKVKFKLSGAKDQQAMLTVAQAPAKAKLSPGTALGTIPGQLDLPAPGVYSIRVKANGYTPHLVDVKVPTEQVVRLKLKEQ